MIMRCNRCHRPMVGSGAYDGACACGGLIEADPTPRWLDTYTKVDPGTGREYYLDDCDWPDNWGRWPHVMGAIRHRREK